MVRRASTPLLVVAPLLAALLWFLTFALRYGNFWIKIGASASTLALLSLHLQGGYGGELKPRWRDLPLGLLYATLLYGIFWIGKMVSTALFPFAGGQIGAIYDKGGDTPLFLITLLLLFVTGPAEELFWRGFLQRQLSCRLGGAGGWIMGAALYAGVHIVSWNFMLIGAAAVAGLFWGLLYWRTRRLFPLLLSHSIWSAMVFALLPIP